MQTSPPLDPEDWFNSRLIVNYPAVDHNSKEPNDKRIQLSLAYEDGCDWPVVERDITGLRDEIVLPDEGEFH